MTQVALITLDELLDKLPNGEAGRTIREAYTFAEKYHYGLRRPAGDLYIDHNLAVAQILVNLGVDVPTVAAGILHDSLLPHTGLDENDLVAVFGTEITSLVVGLNTLTAYAEAEQYKNHQMSQTDVLEAIWRAILTIVESSDIRVMLIKLADLLHDMRRASSLPESEGRALATEAMNVYAPLANRLSIWQMKWELEDLAFRFLEPDTYKEIANQLDTRRSERDDHIESWAALLRTTLDELALNAEVTGRPKHIYSIYRKMKRKGVDFKEIYDVQALRVILEPADPEVYAAKNLKEKEEEDRNLCYQVLGAVHSLWKPVSREFDDYIATPKANGYQSLHTAVIDPETGLKLEVQIRSRRMHETAEFGVASHWVYKEGGVRVGSSLQNRIRNLRDILTATLRDAYQETADIEMLENEVAAERIFIFTPKGDLFDLPSGATPIDFAYQVHTEVGNRCRGARVNDKMVTLNYGLQSGDHIEIITAKRGGPSRDWMNPTLGYTGLARTRSKIRSWFRNQEREQNILQGRDVVIRELKRLSLTDTYAIADIASALKYDEEDEFLARVGFGDIQSAQISGAIALMKNELKPDDELRPLLRARPNKGKGPVVQGVSGLATKMAGCCQPIPPEKIIGFITRGQGVTIHRADCAQVRSINEPERLIAVDWGSEEETYPIPIVIKAYQRPGLIEDIVNTLRGEKVESPRAKTMTAKSITTVYLEVEITSLDQLHFLLQKLENLPNVFETSRQRWN